MSTTAIVIPQRSVNIYQSIVLNILKKMHLGSLRLTLHTGEVINIGNGQGVAAEMTVNHVDFYKKGVLFGDVGFGESYMDGDWSTPDITKVISWFLYNV